jgi:hypothetical protein
LAAQHKAVFVLGRRREDLLVRVTFDPPHVEARAQLVDAAELDRPAAPHERSSLVLGWYVLQRRAGLADALGSDPRALLLERLDAREEARDEHAALLRVELRFDRGRALVDACRRKARAAILVLAKEAQRAA